jgi:hypothetical protein
MEKSNVSKNEYKKICSYQLEDCPIDALELKDGTIPCWTSEGIKLFQFENNSLKLLKSFPVSTGYWNLSAIEKENGDIIYRSGTNELTVYDPNFNRIQRIDQDDDIYSLCNLSDESFAIGLENRTIKIFSKNQDSKKYEEKNEYTCHSKGVRKLLHLPKQNLLLCGFNSGLINVLNLSEGKSIKELKDHNYTLNSFVSISDDMFASASYYGEIKIWCISNDNNIECVKTLQSQDNCDNAIILNRLGKDFMISRTFDSKEFKIWNVKNHECLGTFKEDSEIKELIVSKNNDIFTLTRDNNFNVWKI